MYLTYHSYAQIMGYGWGYDWNLELPKNVEQLDEMARIATEAMGKSNGGKGRKYRFGNIVDLLGPAAGRWLYKLNILPQCLGILNYTITRSHMILIVLQSFFLKRRSV